MGYNIITGFNMVISQEYGMSSFPLTFIFFKIVKTINQYFLDICFLMNNINITFIFLIYFNSYVSLPEVILYIYPWFILWLLAMFHYWPLLTIINHWYIPWIY